MLFFIITRHAALRPKSVSEMPNILFSLPTLHLGDSAPLITLGGLHYLPCDCAPPVSVTDPGIDIWPQLGWADTLPRIWNRDKEAESLSCAEPSCKVMASWSVTAATNLILVSEGKLRNHESAEKVHLQKDGADVPRQTETPCTCKGRGETEGEKKICIIPFWSHNAQLYLLHCLL